MVPSPKRRHAAERLQQPPADRPVATEVLLYRGDCLDAALWLQAHIQQLSTQTAPFPALTSLAAPSTFAPQHNFSPGFHFDSL